MCDILCFVVVIGGSGGRMGFLKPFYVHFFYVFKNAILKTYIAMWANITRGVW